MPRNLSSQTPTQGNLLQLSSSLPSVQSRVPSQRSEVRMHCLLLHRNAPLLQEATHWNRVLKYQITKFGITLLHILVHCIQSCLSKCSYEVNVLQFISSLPSEHPPDWPLHRKEEETHWPLAHRNWVEVQPVCIVIGFCLLKFQMAFRLLHAEPNWDVHTKLAGSQRYFQLTE